MNRFRFIVGLMVAAVVATLGVSAQEATSLRLTNKADSASAAVATVWGQYLRPSLMQSPEFQNSDDIDKYIDGLSESLSKSGKTDPRTRGMLEGIQLATRLAEIESMGISLDRTTFVEALRAALLEEPTGFTPATADGYMQARLQAGPAIDETYARSQAEFVAAQAAQPGSVTTPSGLVFQVITEGEGAMPADADDVKVNYVGRLSDGKEFDNSNGRPVVFGVSKLIPGFTEGLKMMKPGGTYRLVIPADLGYGNRGAGRDIPGGAALDFTVELLEVIPSSK